METKETYQIIFDELYNDVGLDIVVSTILGTKEEAIKKMKSLSCRIELMGNTLSVTTFEGKKLITSCCIRMKMYNTIHFQY